MKKARHKSIHTVEIHLYEVLEQTKPIDSDRKQMRVGLPGWRDTTDLQRDTREHFRGNEMFSVLTVVDGGRMGIYNYQDPLSCAPKIHACYCM